MTEHWRSKQKMMYVSYVKALTVANKLNCIIFWIQPVLTKTCRLQCLAIKNTVNHLRYSVQFFPNTCQLSLTKNANRTWSYASFCHFRSHSCPQAYRFFWPVALLCWAGGNSDINFFSTKPPNSHDYTWLDRMR